MRAYLFTAAFLSLAAAGRAQNSGPATLSGVVLNAATNQPVARALVRVGSHGTLTERDGRFEFSDTAGSTATLEVMKPGFYGGMDSTASGRTVNFSATASEPLKIYLYPEALITGTLSAPNGDPLAGVVVQALHKAGVEDNGGLGWMPAGVAISNSDGDFRLPLPADDYIVETQFQPNQSALQKAVLPLLAPEAGDSIQTGGQPTLHLTAGSELHLDLRPQVRSTREVRIRSEGSPSGASQSFQPQAFLQIEASLGNGLSFYPATRPSGTPGEMITMLPSGHYELTAGNYEGEGGSYGQAAVDVPDSSPDSSTEKDTPSVVLHLAKLVPLTVELAVDASSPASTSDNQQAAPPNIQQLGLHFVRIDQTGSRHEHDGYLRTNRNGVPTLTLLPGRYRLLTQPLDHWFIASATIGGTDLTTQELDLEPGGTSTPLRIVISNQTATLNGTVKLNGQPAGRCWIYFLATAPSVTPVVLAISQQDGAFSNSSVPPGSYRAIAFETHNTSDLNDKAKLERLAAYTKSFSVAPGQTVNLDLEAVPTVELVH